MLCLLIFVNLQLIGDTERHSDPSESKIGARGAEIRSDSIIFLRSNVRIVVIYLFKAIRFVHHERVATDEYSIGINWSWNLCTRGNARAHGGKCSAWGTFRFDRFQILQSHTSLSASKNSTSTAERDINEIEQLESMIGRLKLINRKKSHERFHLTTRYENLTLNCCRDCSGEIHVVWFVDLMSDIKNKTQYSLFLSSVWFSVIWFRVLIKCVDCSPVLDTSETDICQ